MEVFLQSTLPLYLPPHGSRAWKCKNTTSSSLPGSRFVLRVTPEPLVDFGTVTAAPPRRHLPFTCLLPFWESARVSCRLHCTASAAASRAPTFCLGICLPPTDCLPASLTCHVCLGHGCTPAQEPAAFWSAWLPACLPVPSTGGLGR